MLKERAIINDAFVIASTETHLKSDILDAEIRMPGYEIFRGDRVDYIRKGAVMLYIRDDYSQGLIVP